MKFRWKILISNLFLLAIAFSVSGFLLIQHSFERNRNREIDVALEENQFIQIALENELVYLIRRNEFEGLDSLTEAAAAIAGNYADSKSDFAVTDSRHTYYYNAGTYKEVRWELIENLTERGQKNYIVYKEGKAWYVETAGSFSINNADVFIFSRRDISTVFEDRDQMLGFYALTASLVLVICSVINFLLALWLTIPIMHLNRTASVIASGSYFVRCRVNSDDEIGELGKTFNRMAEAIENHVTELIEEARRKEDFVGNFTHEIKTPLTSIIGYADMIRSRNLSDETRILAANFIFNEGMRLETMSMKLFDLLLLNKEELQLVPIRVQNLFEQIMESTEPMLRGKDITLEIQAEDIYILGDPDLLKTAFINMVDNSRKASQEGSSIILAGYRTEEGTFLEVRDFGFGIPEEEIQKITEAFYMVDKSRSRESGGAGLGLALTDLILKKNGGKLSILSKVGEGTTMRVAFQSYDHEETNTLEDEYFTEDIFEEEVL